METTTTTIIELNQWEITSILINHLQKLGKLKNNIHVNNINIREENGQVKCTIIDSKVKF